MTRFEQKGFKLVGCKEIMASKELLGKHYAELASKPFFNGLVEYMSSGPVVAMVWEGDNVVASGRKMLGATKPSESAPGTISGDLGIQDGRYFFFASPFLFFSNIVHGSDSVENAKREIDLWFPEGVCEWNKDNDKWIYEN